MRKHSWIVALVAVAMTLVPETALASTLSTSDDGPVAFGGGHYTVTGHSSFFIFTAKANETGGATGRLIWASAPYAYDALINCLVVVGGNAFMSGYITHSNDPQVPPGSSVDFGVKDDDASPRSVDLISQVDFRFNEICTTFHEPPIYPLDRGLIEVRRGDPDITAAH